MKTALKLLLLVLAAAPAPAQNLFVSDSGNHALYKFTPDGTRSTFASGWNYPAGLAFDAQGNLFVSDTTAIRKFAPEGTEHDFATGLYWPSGLAFDAAGNLFASDAGDGPVFKFSPGGAGTIFLNGLVSQPEALAFDAAGNLLVADYAMGTIVKVSLSGAQTNFGILAHPYGLAFDRAGNLFVTETYGGNRIDKFSPDGTQSVFASLPGELPMGLAFDSAGNLFVACYQSGNIYQFTPEGTRTTFASGLSQPTDLAFQPAPVITRPCLSDGCMKFCAAGGRMNATCFVLSSTNMTLPLTNWSCLATNRFDPTGHFDFTDTSNSSAKQLFYRLQVP